MRGGGEHGGVASERLADQDGLPEPQLIEDRDDVGDVRGARAITRVPLAGTVAALVDGDDPVVGAQIAGDGVPFARVPGQPVQQENGGP
ncbi:hypothetical protein GCM10018966_061540 [Streptomyces yanii]